MKKKYNYLPIIIFIVVTFLIIITPKTTKQKLSGFTISMITPFWEKLYSLKNYFFTSTYKITAEKNNEALTQLQMENQHLKNELKKLNELFQHELNLITQFASVFNKDKNLYEDAIIHKKEILNLINSELKSTPARVIFRSNSSWSSSLWVNVGSNQSIKKNSPVISGKSIVGVIDYVGKNQSRVRLITDSGLCPSVRVSRGEFQNRLLKENLHFLSGLISIHSDLFDSPQEKQKFINELDKLRSRLLSDQKNWLLAKGELHGKSAPVWRSSGQLLKGIGFNYDFPDEEGPARDLRTGKAINFKGTLSEGPIIQENDLLVTTGYDGIFPSGFPIAIVSKIFLLKEGDYYFEIEAKPTAGNLDEIDFLFILPPQTFDSEDQPTLYD